MSYLSPKPIITHVVRTWRIPPGLTFALVKDAERRVWIVEACPAGTHFWTVAQAAELIPGARTRHALRQAVAAGCALEQQALTDLPAERKAEPEAPIRKVAEKNSSDRLLSLPNWEEEPVRPLRRRRRSSRPADEIRALVRA